MQVVDETCSELLYDSSTNDAKAQEYVATYRRKIVKNLSYQDIGRIIMGRWGRYIVNIFVFITQFGFCVNYHIFIGNLLYGILLAKDNQTDFDNRTTRELSNSSSLPLQQDINNSEFHVNLSLANITQSPEFSSKLTLILLVLAPLPIFILFTCFRHIRHMSLVSLVANVCVLTGAFVLLFYIVSG